MCKSKDIVVPEIGWDIIPGQLFFEDTRANNMTAGEVLDTYKKNEDIHTIEDEELVVSNYRIWTGDCR